MTNDAAWLPSSLEPVAMRIARADQATEQLGQLALAWSTDAVTVSGVQTSDGFVEITVDTIRPIPPIIPILFSEAIHHLRAAVENTVFYTVESFRGSPLPELQARRVAMPIFHDPKTFDDWAIANDRKGLGELAPGSILASRLESLQAFKDRTTIPSISPELAAVMGVTADEVTPLALLQEYSNVDKHRMIRLGLARSVFQSSNVPFATADLTMREVNVGDVLGSVPQGSPVMIETNTAIHVERPGGSAWVAPARELGRLLEHISTVVIPTIVLGMALSRGIPPEINLADTGKTLRQRIDDGGWLSAHQRLVREGSSAFVESLSESPTSLRMQDNPDGFT